LISINFQWLFWPPEYC